MSDILSEIVEATSLSLGSRKARVSASDLRGLPGFAEERRGFGRALVGQQLAVIAEHKRRSPSKGPIREDLSLEDIIARYAFGGAAAVSVLTEPLYFGGSLDDLASARRITKLPLLRKDFFVDEYQIVEARAYGADAILLIAAALDPALLADLHSAATEEGLDVLVEVHSVEELDLVDLDSVRLVGVNNRDLRTFEVDIETSARVFPCLPEQAVRVSESGYHTEKDILRAVDMRADAVLIGERLMRDPDPGTLLKKWIQTITTVGQNTTAR